MGVVDTVLFDIRDACSQHRSDISILAYKEKDLPNPVATEVQEHLLREGTENFALFYRMTFPPQSNDSVYWSTIFY